MEFIEMEELDMEPDSSPPPLEHHEKFESICIENYPTSLPLLIARNNVKMECTYKNNTLWSLQIDLSNSIVMKEKCYLSAILTRDDRLNMNVNVCIDIRLLDRNNHILFAGQWEAIGLPDPRSACPTAFACIRNGKFSSLPNKQLILEWRISVGKCCDRNFYRKQIKDAKARSKEDPFLVRDLQTGFYAAYLHYEHRDIVLKSGLQEDIPANIFILATRSPFFRRILLKNDGSLAIINNPYVDMEGDMPVFNVSNPFCKVRGALELFVIYLYCAVIRKVPPAVMRSVYALAHQFEVTPLKELCCEEIGLFLSFSNVCETIEIAYLHSDARMIEYVLKFVRGHIEKVVNAIEFKALRTRFTEFEKDFVAICTQIDGEMLTN